MAVAAVLVGGIVVASMSDGEPSQDVRLLSGAAWLTSSKVGQLTLLDGSSAEVAAQVQVAPAGNSLDVAQQGSTAYAIDQSAGTVRRVDGATFTLTPPEAPIPDSRAGLTAMPGPDVLYTLDSRRGVLANADPRSLVRRGELVSLASELASGSAVVDGSGTLWAIDTRTGDLTYVRNGKRNIRREVVKPGPSALVIANGSPVVADIAARKMIKIDRANGRSGSTIELDLRTTDNVQISGSPRSDRVYLVAGRGVLTICALSTDSCDNTIPLNEGSKYGPAVEAGNQVFVPDYTTGQVWIIDLAKSTVIAKPTVLSPPVPFQLVSRDGVVFYNDTNSERAGVVQLDGKVVQANKYDPDFPQRGLSGQPQTNPSRTPEVSRPQQPDEVDQPSGTQGTDPGNSQSQQPDQSTDPSSPGPGTGTTTPAERNQPRLEIAMSSTTPAENQVITLRVTNANGDQPRSAHWTFGDGEEGDGTTTSHQWRTARSYVVTVTATMPDDQVAMTTVDVTVSETPRNQLTVSIPGGGGTVSGGGINCPGTCSVALEQDTQVTLTAAPDATHQAGTWGGACSGRTTTCDVTLDAAKNVTYTFEVRPAPQVTLTIASPSNGTITRSGGGTCPSACQADLPQGSQVQLTANPNSGFEFGGWGGACAGQGATCTLTMSADRNVSATFPQIPAPVITSLTCEEGLAAFSCDVATTPATGVRIQWFFDDREFSANENKKHVSFGCGGTSPRSVSVKVIASNVRGDVSRQSTGRCGRNF